LLKKLGLVSPDVIPAQAGIHKRKRSRILRKCWSSWIPACAGMTVVFKGLLKLCVIGSHDARDRKNFVSFRARAGLMLKACPNSNEFQEMSVAAIDWC
jgi:hypothetical protein